MGCQENPDPAKWGEAGRNGGASVHSKRRIGEERSLFFEGLCRLSGSSYFCSVRARV
ncbi:unnamed protein product [Amoebophrya sp. A25]|nr:unnamed protein product [Amoebophrya sp. A25]|eukprot:GSA25T00023813001.1